MKIHKNDSLITTENLSAFTYNKSEGRIYKVTGKLMRSKTSTGSLVISIRGKFVYQNRIVCFLNNIPFTPCCSIEHIDGDVSNISVENLKVVPHVEPCFDTESKEFIASNDKYIPHMVYKYKYNKETGEFIGARGVVKPCEKGYVQLQNKVNGVVRSVSAHRVACHLLGYDISKGEVDHIDGDGTNNKASNLRVVSRSVNRRNSAISSANTSGMVGVSWHKHQKKWEVRVCGKMVGYSRDFFEACCIRKSYENKAGGFTVRHGEKK